MRKSLFISAFFVMGWITPDLFRYFNKRLEGGVTTDYQINIHMDTIWLYDGSRLVGKVLNTWNSPLDSLILKDNN